MNRYRWFSRLYYWGVIIITYGWLIYTTITQDDPIINWWGYAVLAFFSALLSYFPLDLFLQDINLVHILALNGWLLYDDVRLLWAVIIGMLIGSFARLGKRDINLTVRYVAQLKFLRPFIYLAYMIIALVAVDYLFAGLQTPIGMSASTVDVWLITGIISLVYVLIFLFLNILSYFLVIPRPRINVKRHLLTLVLASVLPLPFMILDIQVYPLISLMALVSFGSVMTIFSILLSQIGLSWLKLDRREIEYSILYDVSKTLSHAVEIDNLLDVVHRHITELIGVDNFYVALYEAEKEMLWYPLAVREGVKVNYPQRRLYPNRLTDRVILTGQPILYHGNKDVKKTNEPELEIPHSQIQPKSWMGVPLISGDKQIGCLAVFSAQVEHDFDENDLNILQILAGNVSVAIQNVLLFQSERNRTRQLETINKYISRVSLTLNLEDVFNEIINSVAEALPSKGVVIYLISDQEKYMEAAASWGLGERIALRLRKLLIEDSGPGECIRAEDITSVDDVRLLNKSVQYYTELLKFGVYSTVSVPLITPDGPVGVLAIYLDKPHVYSSAEIDILQIFASHASLAIANATKFKVTDESLAKKVEHLSLLETIGREFASAIDSDKLFELVLDYGLRFTKAEYAALGVYDWSANNISVKYFIGYEPDVAKQKLTKWVNRCLSEVSQDSPAKTQDVYLEYTSIAAPLWYKNQLVGLILLEHSQGNGSFNESDISFVRQLASQAGIAIRNAELYNEVQRRLHDQMMLYQVTQRLVATLNIHDIVFVLSTTLKTYYQPAFVGIYLYDERTDIHQLITPDSLLSPGKYNNVVPMTIWGRLDTVIDINSYHPQIESPKSDILKVLGIDYSGGSCIIAPLGVTTRYLGFVILLLQQGSSITEDDLRLLDAILAQGSLSIQNALLYSSAKDDRDRLLAVLNSVSDGVLMFTPDGVVIFHNAQVREILGDVDIANRSFSSLPENVLTIFGFSEKDRDLFSNVNQLRNVADKYRKTYRLERGSVPIYLEREIVPVFGGPREVTGWLLFVRNVTEEIELEQTRQFLVETLVHDLRSPMSAVVGALDIMDEMTEGTSVELSDFVHPLSIAKRGADRVVNLIESIMEISRIESGKFELDLERVDLGDILNKVVNDYETRAADVEINFLWDKLEKPLLLVVDREMIIRVIGNLLDNAFKFTPKTGTVKLAIRKDDEKQRVEIGVLDTGPGVPDEYKKQIFDKYVQVPGVRARKRGTGLGLAFCRLIIEAHGGEIWVEDGEGGVGSRFVFTLPIN